LTVATAWCWSPTAWTDRSPRQLRDSEQPGVGSPSRGLLGDDESDRERLLHILRSLRRDRDEPLPSAIADRFEMAIERNIHINDDRGER
jgi:hypothetical protein